MKESIIVTFGFSRHFILGQTYYFALELVNVQLCQRAAGTSKQKLLSSVSVGFIHKSFSFEQDII